MKLKIKILPEKKFIGQRITMSISNNKTFELWNNFMSRINEIKNRIGIELYSLEVYPPEYFDKIYLSNEFEKWAAVEVHEFIKIPKGMETITSPEGPYAVFLYKGPASEAFQIYQYIYQNWIPNSEYVLDFRPHIAVMGKNYNNESKDSEEEIWIPIKKY